MLPGQRWIAGIKRTLLHAPNASGVLIAGEPSLNVQGAQSAAVVRGGRQSNRAIPVHAKIAAVCVCVG